MIDIRKKKHFHYSQNSLNTFRQCPLKFKMKYMEHLTWKKDGEMDYYENMKKGLDFHLICERYFSNIPVGLIDDYDEHRELIEWTNQLKRTVPISDGNTYYPEYEIRMGFGGVRLQAKYDLVILKPNHEIEIWDWKTEDRPLSQREMEKRVQTMVYMVLMKEGGEGILRQRVECSQMKMIFWQPQYPDQKIQIDYSEGIHGQYYDRMKHMIDEIEVHDFEKDFDKSLVKHCRHCEFNGLCNGERVDWNKLKWQGDV